MACALLDYLCTILFPIGSVSIQQVVVIISNGRWRHWRKSRMINTSGTSETWRTLLCPRYPSWSQLTSGSIPNCALPYSEKSVILYHTVFFSLCNMPSLVSYVCFKIYYYRESPHKTSSHRTNFSIRLILKYFNSSHSK